MKFSERQSSSVTQISPERILSLNWGATAGWKLGIFPAPVTSMKGLEHPQACLPTEREHSPGVEKSALSCWRPSDPAQLAKISGNIIRGSHGSLKESWPHGQPDCPGRTACSWADLGRPSEIPPLPEYLGLHYASEGRPPPSN